MYSIQLIVSLTLVSIAPSLSIALCAQAQHVVYYPIASNSIRWPFDIDSTVKFIAKALLIRTGWKVFGFLSQTNLLAKINSNDKRQYWQRQHFLRNLSILIRKLCSIMINCRWFNYIVAIKKVLIKMITGHVLPHTSTSHHTTHVAPTVRCLNQINLIKFVKWLNGSRRT